MDPVAALLHLGGAARRKDLAPLVSRGALAAAVKDGSVVRRYPGTYALPRVPAPVVAAVHLGGLVSHESAARLWGCPMLAEPVRLHITVPRKAGQRRWPPGVVIHRADIDPADGVGRMTSLDRVVLDCARTLPLTDAVVIGDSALRLGPAELGELGGADLARMRRRASAARGPGARRARSVISLLDPRAESVLESAFRALIHLAGFLPPQTQVTLLAGQARVDFLWPNARLVVEVEGYAFHSDQAALRRDAHRFNALVLADYRPLRFTWDDVMSNQSYVVASLRQALDRAGAPSA